MGNQLNLKHAYPHIYSTFSSILLCCTRLIQKNWWHQSRNSPVPIRRAFVQREMQAIQADWQNLTRVLWSVNELWEAFTHILLWVRSFRYRAECTSNTSKCKQSAMLERWDAFSRLNISMLLSVSSNFSLFSMQEARMIRLKDALSIPHTCPELSAWRYNSFKKCYNHAKHRNIELKYACWYLSVLKKLDPDAN